MEKSQTKAALIKQCKDRIQEQMALLQEAMKDAQEIANQYKGAMESRYDTFKEEAQSKKEAYGRQLHEMTKVMSLLLGLNPSTLLTRVEQGAVVMTDTDNFFISYAVFAEGVEIEGTKYLTISLASPLGQQLKFKSPGSLVTFKNTKINILDVF